MIAHFQLKLFAKCMLLPSRHEKLAEKLAVHELLRDQAKYADTTACCFIQRFAGTPPQIFAQNSFDATRGKSVARQRFAINHPRSLVNINLKEKIQWHIICIPPRELMVIYKHAGRGWQRRTNRNFDNVVDFETINSIEPCNTIES